ncbi:MAG: hypothetical protein QM477_11445 [Planctomycetota bacterium]
MKTIFSIALGGIGVLCASPLTAQTQLSTGTLNPTTSVQHGTYSMKDGFELTTTSYRSGPETIFNNPGPSSYFVTMPAGEEWVDEGAFPQRGLDATEQVNGFDFSYCSLLADPVGNAVTVTVNLYMDTVQGVGPSTWPTAECSYQLAGLPGDTSLGGISCWAVAIDLEGGFECTLPQEAIPGGNSTFFGIGWQYSDAGASGLSGPFLSGMGYGSQDYIEVFDAGGYVGNFGFGGGPNAQANFPVVLYGNGILDTSVVNAEVPDSGDILVLSSDQEFRTGTQVTWSLRGAATPGVAYAMVVGSDGSSAGFGALAGLGTTLLVNPGSILTPPTPLGMSGINPSVQTPALPGLPPTIYAQAFGFSGGVGIGNATEASNALRHLN